MAERLGTRDYYTYSGSDTRIGYSGEYVAYVLDRMGKMKVDPQRCLNEEVSTSFLKQQVEAWIDTIIPGIELNTEIHERSNTVSVEFRKRKLETSFLQPSNIGFGVSYTLPVIVAGLIAPENSIFIVENPEAHLHPSGQSRLGYFLPLVADSGVQTIIETHNEHIINGIRLAVLKKKLTLFHY